MKRKKHVSYQEDLLERLKDPQYATDYLISCLHHEEGDAEGLFLLALRDVAKAHGFTAIAKKTHLSRESLYRSFSKKGNPTWATITSFLDALGLQLTLKTKKAA